MDTCFVIGNGPSLRGFDFHRLRGFETIGMNAAYRYWDMIGWYPTHYCCLDDQLMKTHHKEIRRLFEDGNVGSFFVHHSFFDHYPDLIGNPGFLSLDQVVGYRYRKSVERCASLGRAMKLLPIFSHPAFKSLDPSQVTTAGHAVRWAAYLGYKRIALIGIDLRYLDIIPEHAATDGVGLILKETPKHNPNYFFDGYQRAGDLYNIPDSSEHGAKVHVSGLSIIPEDFARNGVRCEVINCSPQSRLSDSAQFPLISINKVLGATDLAAVVVPTNLREKDDILRNFKMWRQWDYQPFFTLPDNLHKPRIVFSFNNDSGRACESEIREAYLNFGMSNFFSGIDFFYLGLEGDQDLYERDYTKEVGEGGYKAGPNNQFFETIRLCKSLGRYVFLMETDCLPIRRGWLERLVSIVDSSEPFWILGSAYRGESLLNTSIVRHINGNSVYAVGDEGFQSFVLDVWCPQTHELVKGFDKRLAYDCILEIVFSEKGLLDPSVLRTWQRVAHLIRYSDYCQNISSVVDIANASLDMIEKLRMDSPGTFILHNRAVLRLAYGAARTESAPPLALSACPDSRDGLAKLGRAFPRLLLFDMTAMGNGTATGEIKSTLFADWPAHRLLQVARGDKDGPALVARGEDGTYTAKVVAADAAGSAVDDFAPDVILYRPVPDVPGLHEFAMNTIDRLKKPLVSWIMDDWPARLEAEDPRQAANLLPDLARLLRESAQVLSISQAMSDAFAGRYGRSFIPLANGVDRRDWSSARTHEAGPLLVRYSGGLAADMTRDSVLRISRAVEGLAATGVPIRFEINTRKSWFVQSRDLFAGFKHTTVSSETLTPGAYRSWMAAADVVVIAYNFDERSLRYIRYSLANKTPECLASGAVLLAHGPREAATVRYLADSGAAVVVTEASDQAVSDALKALHADPGRRNELAARARDLAFSRHDVTKRREELRKIVVAARDQKSPQPDPSPELQHLRQGDADHPQQAAKAAELTQACDVQAKLAADRQVQIEKVAQERDAQGKLATERQAQLERAVQAKEVQEKLAAERLSQIQQLQQVAESLSRSNDELREELRQACQTANLATKLHVLREADLEDLQSRYREATDVQERQHQLMLQLEGKLRIAAQYFQQLQSSAVTPAVIAAAASPPAQPPRRRGPTRKKSNTTGQE